MKYIGAERLKAEIERKIAQYSNWAEEEWEDDREYNHGAFGAFKNARLIIDLTRNAYGKDAIRQLEDSYEDL